jgi:murein DD-endopeptidase MepM/ murein hydrolase activator NlpD
VLVIKPMRVHIVTSADSLFSISQRYAISRYQLAQMNGLNEPYELTVGQRLALPDTLDFSILDAAPDGSGTSPAVTNVAAAAATPAPAIPRKRFVAPTGTGDFRWPLAGEIITEFGPAARGVHNDGVNIAAEQGAAVMSAARGTVAFVGRDIKSFGTLVLVKHDGGIITAYAHLDQVMVREGDVVEAGSQIATVGTSGKVAAPQLHFEIRKSRQPIDPRRLIA